MFVLACPRCDDPVRLPSDLDERAAMRCPLCLETIPPHEMAELLPPVLVYADDSDSFDSATVAGDFAAEPDFGDVSSSVVAASTATADWEPSPGGADLDDGEVNFIDEDGTDEIDPQYDLGGEPPSTSVQTAGPAAAPGVQTRPKRKKKSGLLQAVGIIVGGLLAVPLAGGLLMAVGKAPDVGIWPFDGTYNGTSNGNRTAYRPPPVDQPAGGGYEPPSAAEGQSLAAELGSESMIDPAEAAAAAIMNPDAATELPLAQVDPDVVPKASAAADLPSPSESLTDSGMTDVAPVVELPTRPSDGFAPDFGVEPPPSESPSESALDVVDEARSAIEGFDGEVEPVANALLAAAEQPAADVQSLLQDVLSRSPLFPGDGQGRASRRQRQLHLNGSGHRSRRRAGRPDAID